MAKNDPGIARQTLNLIGQPGYLGDTEVVNGLVSQFVGEISTDLATLDPTLTQEAHIERHMAICRRYAEMWAGKNKDYQPQPFHQNPAYLRYLHQGLNIKADTVEDAVYCLFAMLLKDLYGFTEAKASEQLTDDDLKWQLEADMEFFATALLGLDLSEYLNP
jgi:hypothetical protein